MGAPTDQPARQAKLAVDLAVRVLEKRDHLKHVGAPVLLGLAEGPQAQLGVVIAMSALLVWRHRSNIANLRAGTEARIGATGQAPPGAH